MAGIVVPVLNPKEIEKIQKSFFLGTCIPVQRPEKI
jgi:hypothetical protein